MFCEYCGETFSPSRKNNIYCSDSCKNKGAVTRRRQRLSRLVSEFLGGECCLCGYNKCNRSLDAHHVDPSKKSFALSVKGLTRSLRRTLKEADKCVLVCKNCHGEIHDGMIDETTLSEVLGNRKWTVDEFIEMINSRKRAETIIRNSEKQKSKYKIDWPDIDEILDNISKVGYSAYARVLGVSDNAIRKHIARNQNMG